MYQSSVGPVKPGVKPGGPPPKAKYSLTTDSETVRRLKGEKYRDERSEKYLKPHAYKLSKSRFVGMTACLLHNEPAS